MRISVVGLGPGPAEWLSRAALARLRLPGAAGFVPTRHFPDWPALRDGVDWRSFDDVYDRAASLTEVSASIAAALLGSAADDVVYAVPGDGALGEDVLGPLRATGATV